MFVSDTFLMSVDRIFWKIIEKRMKIASKSEFYKKIIDLFQIFANFINK